MSGPAGLVTNLSSATRPGQPGSPLKQPPGTHHLVARASSTAARPWKKQPAALFFRSHVLRHLKFDLVEHSVQVS